MTTTFRESSAYSYADILKKNLTESPIGNLDKSLIQSTTFQMKDPETIVYTDAGVNLTHKNLNMRVEKILQDAVRQNIKRMIVISSSVVDAERVLNIVNFWNTKNTGCKLFCTIGVHPHSASRTLKIENWESKLVKLIGENRDVVVAVGECGLDYHRMFSSKEDQIAVFKAQIRIAKELSMPLYLHERKAHEDFADCLNGVNLAGIVHCFTGTPDAANVYLQKGLYLGISGWICNQHRSSDLVESLSVIPNDRIVIETDSPYLVPKDLRYKPVHSEPKFIPHILSRVAYFKRMRRVDLAKVVEANVNRLFNFP